MSDTIPVSYHTPHLYAALDQIVDYIRDSHEPIVEVIADEHRIALIISPAHQTIIEVHESCPEGFRMMRVFLTAMYQEMTGSDPLDPGWFMLHVDRLTESVTSCALFVCHGLTDVEWLEYAKLLSWEAAKGNLIHFTPEDLRLNESSDDNEDDDLAPPVSGERSTDDDDDEIYTRETPLLQATA